MTFGSQIQAAEMTFLQLGGDLWVDPELTRGTVSHLTLASPGPIGHHASHGVRGALTLSLPVV